VGLQRLALLGAGALFVVLFVGFAIAQGIGNPSVPSDAVAVVEDAPEGLGTISKAKLDQAIQQAAASAQVKPVPKPGEEKYEELQEQALGEVLDTIWIQGQAEEMGFSVTPKEVNAELEKLKKQSFKTNKQYEEFLKEANLTQEAVNERVKVQMLSTKIQEALGEVPPPSSGEIKEYYEAATSSQYTQPESRDIRTVSNKDKAKVEEAKAKLLKDDSVKSWEAVAKKYSIEATKSNGGLQAGVTEGRLPEPLDAAVFAASQGQVEGPVKGASNYSIFEVMKITPEKVQSLEEVKSQISTQLAEQAKQQAFGSFIADYTSTWKSRTFCADGYKIERCSNFTGTGRPPEANPACYEADPKGGLPEACPAPVPQVKPAQPGSVNLLEPEGKKLAQRPRPAGAESTGSEGAAPLGGTVPPPSEK
jgi:parvulin-like peptidyl-prolyl isomerase